MSEKMGFLNLESLASPLTTPSHLSLLCGSPGVLDVELWWTRFIWHSSAFIGPDVHILGGVASVPMCIS